MQDVIEEHYRRLASMYTDLLSYSPEFVRTLTTKMVDELDLEKDDVFVDLGCGSCIYTLDILDQVPLSEPAIAVDPFEEMFTDIPDDAHLTPVVDKALSFSAKPGTYDKVLMKEAVHHVEDREALFRNLRERLRGPDSRLLLVHVPPKVDYPLFDAALERAENWHADPDDLAALLDKAGFEVDRNALVYEHSLPKERYFAMVANRYMSVLSTFDDTELRAGLQEMEERYRDDEVLAFPDHFDYLTARPS